MTLSCCTPERYDGRSRTLVHRCEEKRGKALTATELATLRRHPVVHPEPSPRLVILGPEAPHPACVIAHADGGLPCSRCCVLLHPHDCECGSCSYAVAHMDDFKEADVS